MTYRQPTDSAVPPTGAPGSGAPRNGSPGRFRGPGRRRTVIGVLIACYLVVRAVLLVGVDGPKTGAVTVAVIVIVVAAATGLGVVVRRRRAREQVDGLRATAALSPSSWAAGGVWTIGKGRIPLGIYSALRHRRGNAVGVVAVEPGVLQWFPNAKAAARGVAGWQLPASRISVLTVSRRVYSTWVHAEVVGEQYPLEVLVMARSGVRDQLLRARFTVR